MSVEQAGERSGSVGRYRIVAEIARGGMATVYLCRRAGEAGFTRLFAMKVMHPHLAEDGEFVSMLLDEAHIAARVHHPNAVGIVDLGVHEGGYFVVMEYVEGCSLSDLLRRSKEERPPQLLVPILIDALRGLHAAHSLEDDEGEPLHLIHRDISPHNILVGVDGVGRITDFGIAKAEARITSTRPGMHKGKLSYMSPEQLRGEPLDPRSDVFSLGIVLWEALTGRRLFKGTDNASTVYDVLDKEIPPPSEVGLRPPDAFDELVLAALDRDPEGRPPSASALARSLREVALEHDLYAGPAQVGAWVRDVAGDRLEARRAAVAASSRGDAAPTAAVRDGALSLPTMDVPALGGLTPSRSEVLQITPSAPPPRRGLGGKAVALVSLVALALGALGAVALYRPSGPTPAAAPPPPPASTHATAPEPEPEPAPEPEPEADPEAEAEDDVALVSAEPPEPPPPRRRRWRPRRARRPAPPQPAVEEPAEPPAEPEPAAPAEPHAARLEQNPYLRR